MCGRFASTLPPDAIRALFRTAGPAPNLAPSWNVGADAGLHGGCAGIQRRAMRRLDLLRWGLIPSWTKDLKAARKADQRPVGDGGQLRDVQGRPGGAALPGACGRLLRVAHDARRQAALRDRPAGRHAAGLRRVWEGWRSPDGEVVRTFAILTTSANATMAQLHERMPVILEPDAWPTWLGEEDTDALSLMRPAGDDVLHLWQVSRAVNSVRNNQPDLLDRVDDPHAPPPSDAPPGENPA